MSSNMLEPGEIRICRACLTEITNGNYTEFEENSIKTNLKELISTYLPGIEIKVEHPCLCYECFSTLYLFHNLTKRCSETEEKLRLYVKEKPGEDVVDLHDVLTSSDDVVSVELSTVVEEPQFNNPEEIPEVPLGDNVKLFSCKLCEGLSFNRRDFLLNHLTEMHNKRRDCTCLICYEDFPNNLQLRLHRRDHKRRIWRKVNYDPFQMEKDGAPAPMILNCVLCTNKSFPNESLLRDHMQDVHNKKRDTVCLLCLRELKTPRSLANHVVQHKGDLKNKCYICGKSFVLLDGLKHHVSVVHQDNASIKKNCQHCGRKIPFAHFGKHLELHEQPVKSKHVCSICNWVYASSSGLVLHLKARHRTDKNPSNGNKKSVK